MGHPPRSTDEAETYHRRHRALLGLAGLAAAAVAWWRPFRVEVAGESMRPALGPGDWAVATRRGPVGPGAVVVAERPDRPGFELVKRVARREGDGWFLLGDDPARSTDSRHFGAVSPSAIRGRVRFVYWPPPRWRAL